MFSCKVKIHKLSTKLKSIKTFIMMLHNTFLVKGYTLNKHN